LEIVLDILLGQEHRSRQHSPASNRWEGAAGSSSARLKILKDDFKIAKFVKGNFINVSLNTQILM